MTWIRIVGRTTGQEAEHYCLVEFPDLDEAAALAEAKVFRADQLDWIGPLTKNPMEIVAVSPAYKFSNEVRYDFRTSAAVIAALELASHHKLKVRLCTGDANTGEAWDEGPDDEGYIGVGVVAKSVRVPILKPDADSEGGMALLDHCFVKIQEAEGEMRVLYEHPTFCAAKTYNPMPFEPWLPFPAEVERLCDENQAPARLIAHLRIVHATAVELSEELSDHFPTFCIKKDVMFVGAALHDLGKVLHPHELTGPGNRHEQDGPSLLERLGVPPALARFARTHGTWDREPVEVEDLLVALADTVWKGQRNDALESKIINHIAQVTEMDQWEVFAVLDEILAQIAEKGDDRLEWQQWHA